MPKSVIKNLSIEDICIDAGTQIREKIDEEMVSEYAENMDRGDVFPPIQVVFDGVKNYLTDGFHRYHAARKNGYITIDATVTNGTVREARLASYAANGKHGLRLTNNEKRKCIFFMLDDLEYSDWLDSEIARHCNVSRAFVGRLRKERETPKPKTSAKTPVGDKPIKEEKAKDDLPPEVTPVDSRADDALKMLSEENDTLTQRLAVAAMDATDEEKSMASSLMNDYVKQICLLNIELVSVKISRDRFQAENSELKKQVASLQRHIKKLDQS